MSDEKKNVSEAFPPPASGDRATHSESPFEDVPESQVDYLVLFRDGLNGDLEPTPADADTLDARIARACGEGSFNQLPNDRPVLNDGGVATSDDFSESPRDESMRYIGSINCEWPRSKTGFRMFFARNDDVERGATPIQLLRIPGRPDYPLPESALASLPASIHATLLEQGYVVVTTVYDRENQKFGPVEEGWNLSFRDRRTQTVEAINLARQTGEGLTPAVDYVTIRESESIDIEKLAEIRGVKEDTIKENIRDIERALSKSE